MALRLIHPAYFFPTRDFVESIPAYFRLIFCYSILHVGTLRTEVGTNMGTNIDGFLRNMQADLGTKNPQLRGFS